MDPLALSVISAYAVTATIIATKLSEVIPLPYMDEIFHIPQAQRYCNGSFFEWDSKITTLPGLYFMTVGVLNPLSNWQQQWFCTTSILRLINVGFSTLTMLVLYKLTSQIHGDKHYYDPKKALMSATNLAFFPVLYFFTFLYYTDMGSTFLVLLMYCLHLDGRDWFASLIGAISILFRQTNIVWVFFVATQAASPHLIGQANEALAEKKCSRFSLTTWGQIKELGAGLHQIIVKGNFTSLTVCILKSCGGYLLVALVFLAFIKINNGIVVGDRNAHVAVMHPTQVLYFFGFSLFFGSPFACTRVSNLLDWLKKNKVLSFFLAFLSMVIVKNYTIAHPYLLADNRHYTFYIWRRLIVRTEYSALVLVPIYMYGAFSILFNIRRSDLMLKIALPLCLIINLLPNYLLEFRYFVIPFVMQRLQVRPCSWWKLVAEHVLFQAINVITLYLFIFKPFRWNHDPEEWQRFMW